jgi:hypothetical protein
METTHTKGAKRLVDQLTAAERVEMNGRIVKHLHGRGVQHTEMLYLVDRFSREIIAEREGGPVDVGIVLYERLTEARGLTEKMYPPTERKILLVVIDALLPIWKPPTEEEVDGALERIATAEELAHDTACAAIRLIRAMEKGGGALIAYGELKDVAARYEEAMR